MKAIQIKEFGGPEVLRLQELPEPPVPDGRIRINVAAAGINFADTHKVEESYATTANLPFIPGTEIVGTTDDGRRVLALLVDGGYADVAFSDPSLTWDVPDGVSDGAALALVLQGTTAWHLLKTSVRLLEGESVVVHAAAGGVGTLAVQLAKRFGTGRVIGVASTDDKRRLAESLGADATVDGTSEDLTEALLEANDGKPVDVVLEMVGGRTFQQSFDALAPFGRMVSYGMAGREMPPDLAPAALFGTSRGVMGFWFAHMRAQPERIGVAMRDLLAMVAAGELEPVVGATYDLADARKAHEDLRGRMTTGKLILTCT